MVYFVAFIISSDGIEVEMMNRNARSLAKRSTRFKKSANVAGKGRDLSRKRSSE